MTHAAVGVRPKLYTSGDNLFLTVAVIVPSNSRRRVHYNASQLIAGPVAGLVGIEGGLVSGMFNRESSGVEASDWRPRHDERYHEAFTACGREGC
jgi:hypothetical protein